MNGLAHKLSYAGTDQPVGGACVIVNARAAMRPAQTSSGDPMKLASANAFNAAVCRAIMAEAMLADRSADQITPGTRFG